MTLLQAAIPAVNERTRVVLKAWTASSTARMLLDKGQRQFPAARFRHFPPRCVFVEHTVPANPELGLPRQVYGCAELLKLVDWANYRILNANSFSVLSEGHTPTRDELASGRPMPDVLGYAGPFYLGQYGDVDPRWAIYADEWIHHADLDRFERRQRRSPEIWVGDPLECRTMDPIAVLGAETPRLDCGLIPYSRASDGQTVIRASQVPTPSSVCASVLSRGPNRSSRSGSVSGECSMTHPVASIPTSPTVPAVDPSLLEQTIRQVIADLLPSMVPAATPPLTAPASGDVVIDPGPARGLDMLPAEDDLALAEAENELCQQYSAVSDEYRRAFRAGWGRARAAHSGTRLDELHQLVARQQVRLQGLVDQLARERRDTTRYSRLCELSQQYAFDPREEAETCRDMTDPQFDRHCTATIVKYSRRDDVSSLELFHDPNLSADAPGRTRVSVEQMERYSREAAATAVRKNAAQRGSTTSKPNSMPCADNTASLSDARDASPASFARTTTLTRRHS